MGIAFGRKFREIRKNKGFTQKALGEMLGLSHVTVVGWEKGSHYPAPTHFPLLEQALGVKMSEIIKLDSPASSIPGADLTPLSQSGVRLIPVVGMASAAHYDPSLSQLSDLFQGGDAEQIPCFIPDCDDCFALRICGDSMAPSILPGDIVIVRDRLPETGKACVALHRTDGILLKRWYWRRGVIRLESINEDSGKTYTWTKEEFARENPLVWRFRVESLYRKNPF